MSQPQEIPPIACITCKRLVHYAVVQSNASGNRGRYLAKCTDTNSGVTCNFFRWLPASSLSPRPAVVQPGGRAPSPFTSVPVAGGMQNSLPLPLAPSQKPTCLAMGCNSTRIRKDCGRRMCKAHCREAGGCADPAHKGSQMTANSFVAAVLPTATPIPSVSTPVVAAVNTSSTPSSSIVIDPILLQSDVQMAAPLLAFSSTVPTHAHTEPAFASHISQVFTSQMAREEQLREISRQREATRIDSKQKAQQTVFVYAWTEDDIAPATFEVQDGFVWPHFILNEAVLLSAGFTNVSPDIRFNIWRFNLGHWTTVKLNHVIELKDIPHVFIKSIHIRRCPEFTEFLLLSTPSFATSPNIRTNLAGERTYVKKKMLDHEISQAHKARFHNNKHSLSPESLSSTPKRPRILSDEPPTPTPIPKKPILAPKRKLPPGSTRIRKKVSAATQERELMDRYDSDSGLEFTDPFPFSKPSTSTPSVLTNPSSQVIIKREEANPTVPLAPFLIPLTRVSKAKGPRWPADFFAVTIANFFEEIDDNASDGRVRKLFEHHFGQWVPFKRTTFYEHRQRWEIATLDVKNAVLSAGYTQAGCWINLMSSTPAPRALIKTARRQNNSRANVFVDPEVIDISSSDLDCEA